MLTGSWDRSPRPLRRIVGGTLVVVGVVAAFWLLFLFHELILVLLAAIVISTAVQIPVSSLTKRGVPKWSAILLIFILGVILLGGMLWLLVPLIGNQIVVMGQELSEGYAALRQSMVDSSNLLLRRLGTAFPAQPPSAALFSMTDAAAEGNGELGQTAQLVTESLKALLGLVITIVMAFYWTWEEAHIKQRIYLLLPMSRRTRVRQVIQDIENKVGQYIIGQAFLSLIVGIVSLVAYLLIGLPYAIPLAVFAGLMEAVPLIGPWIGAVPAILVAFSVSPSSAIWVIVASAIIQQLENNLLVPRVMERTVGVRPLVSLLALLGLGQLFGVVGALIAIPLAATFQLLLDDWLAHRDEELQNYSEGRDQISRLRYQTDLVIEDIRNHIRGKQDISTETADEIEDAVELLAHDLQTVLVQGRSGEEEQE